MFCLPFRSPFGFSLSGEWAVQRSIQAQSRSLSAVTYIRLRGSGLEVDGRLTEGLGVLIPRPCV